MVDFNSLKKNRASALNELRDTLNTQSGRKQFKADERYWQPTVDKVGNGHAVIRFLQPQEGVPYVRLFSHAFKGPTGQWYIENSRSTLGRDEPDPVGEYNSKLWNSGQEDAARGQKRQLKFISNILVIKDRANPENEGTVRLFKYGKKIFEKLSNVMSPPFDEEGRAIDHPDYDPKNAYNPFDLWDGAPFTIKIRQVQGYRNYDESVFGTQGPLDSSDDKIKQIWEQTVNVEQFTAPDQFKPYAELSARLNRVLGLSDQAESENVRSGSVQKTAPAPSQRTVATDDDDQDELAKLLAEISDDD